MWSVSFQEYLKFNGVREGINEAKKAFKKERMAASVRFFGDRVEEGVTKILSDFDRFEVKVLSPQMDIGFGADIQISYKENGKNYSFFADITAKPKEVKYLTVTGAMTKEINEALCYRTEYFNIRFGFKEKHGCRFFYEKPVVVLYVENYVPTTGIAHHHLFNICELMMTMNSFLTQKGYGARASQVIRPNLKRFRSELKK